MAGRCGADGFFNWPAVRHYSSWKCLPCFDVQVALQTAYFLGNMHWAESDRARLVLQLLGFPKVRGTWDLALVSQLWSFLVHSCFCAHLIHSWLRWCQPQWSEREVMGPHIHS